jgi:hypothetical protein
MRLFAVVAAIAVTICLGGCFHHNQVTSVEAPQPLPPLK